MPDRRDTRFVTTTSRLFWGVLFALSTAAPPTPTAQPRTHPTPISFPPGLPHPHQCHRLGIGIYLLLLTHSCMNAAPYCIAPSSFLYATASEASAPTDHEALHKGKLNTIKALSWPKNAKLCIDTKMIEVTLKNRYNVDGRLSVHPEAVLAQPLAFMRVLFKPGTMGGCVN